MKTLALNLVLAILSLSFVSCEKETLFITPSHQTSFQDYSVTAFDDLHVSDAFEVYVTFSDTEEALTIEANQNVQQLVEVRQKNGTLFIELDDNVHFRGNQLVLKAHLTTKNIETITALGATSVYLTNPWIETRPEVILSGACYLEGQIIAEELNADLTGASNLDIEGTSNYFNIQAEGASNMKDFDFVTDQLHADLTGSSNLSLTVTQTLHVTASGASNVYYKGDGYIEYQHLTGASNIIKK